MFTESELNEYSKRVYKYLKLNKPFDWASVESHPCDSGKNYLSIEIKCPNSKVEDNLFFSTEDGRLTVGFHTYHCHFDSFANLDSNEELNSAISIICSIIREKLVVVSYYEKEEFLGSYLEERDKLDPEHLQRKDWIITKPSKIEILSWLGTHDRVISIKEKSGRFFGSKRSNSNTSNLNANENFSLWSKIKAWMDQ